MDASSNPSSPVGLAAALFLRLALAAAFLSAVADRFGVWGEPGDPGVAWGDFDRFLTYTASLVPFLPEAGVSLVGWTATVSEIALGLALLVGFKVRAAAAGGGLLLLAFALGMMLEGGLKPPLDASVLTASAGAFLLSVYPHSYLSVDGGDA
jgi:uncharacterized membrane protein YphA (DoxX/SURF4 family)